MNSLKKFLSLILVLAMVLSMAMGMVGCGNNEEPDATEAPAEAGGNVNYSISVHTQGGMALEGVDVYIYTDSSLSSLEQYGRTDAEGCAIISMPESSDYAIVLSGVAAGYEVSQYYTFNGKSADIKLNSGLIQGESLATAQLGLGDVMYDFSVTTPAGENITLSEMLAEKEMVLINFWYTTCTYCVEEFPYMEEAYQQYQDKVGIIALNPMNEGDAAITSFQETMGLSFPMAGCQTSWSAAFGISGYPTSVIVDRYGVICLIEVGGILSLSPFISTFEHFTGDDYEQRLIEGGVNELNVAIKPTYEWSSSEEVAALINNGDIAVSYRPEEGDDAEYSWPFIAAEKNGETCIKASNQEIENSYAIMYMDVELKAGEAVGFDYLVSSEKSSDVLHVIVNDEPIYTISGVSDPEEWKSCYPWVALEDGTYEVALCYIKDESDNEGDDTVYIKNARIVSENEVDVATYIPRDAAVTEDGFEYTYVDIFLNEKDGYYHVGSENGPLLMANLMMPSNFNEEKSVWDLAYDGTITVDGHNYYDDLVDYCNYASNSSLYGYCTVNERLAELLKIVADVAGFDGTDTEWMKLCTYYQVYGSGDSQLEDPIKGLETFSAYKAKLGKNVSTNYFYYDRPIIPRGMLAEFTPSQSGVYRITSRNESQHGVEGWIFDENHQGLYTYEQSERLFNDSNNVSMLYYMEAGKSYYIDIAFWDVYEVGYIYYDIEYVGASMDLFRTCAPSYFTYDSDATGDAMYYLITGGINVVLGEDGIYYQDLGKDANGNQKYGSKIYADFTGVTGIFGQPISTVPAYNEDGTIQKDSQGNTVYISGMIDMGGFDFSKSEDDLYILSFLKKYDNDVDATDAYLRDMWGEEYESYAELYQLEDVYKGKYHGTGEDLTEEIRTYVDDIITSGSEEVNGCVVVTERLAELLQLVMDKYTFENVEDSWLKICYYYQHMG